MAVESFQSAAAQRDIACLADPEDAESDTKSAKVSEDVALHCLRNTIDLQASKAGVESIERARGNVCR